MLQNFESAFFWCIFAMKYNAHPDKLRKTKLLSSLEYGQAQVKLLLQQQMELDGLLTIWAMYVLVYDPDWVLQEKVNWFRQDSARSNIP